MSPLIWQKSSHSSEGNNCLEVATAQDDRTRLLRESDAPATVLTAGPAALAALLAAVKAGGLHPR
ncbi:DUF397 domain-containing protein [Streptomyces sp. NPDC003077]|uniref:DUF397 domain-containing protein n=1 Tax=Streptomyces sp. NPDC003077 TaxID=3154443 RepID=UPI0033B890EE